MVVGVMPIMTPQRFGTPSMPVTPANPNTLQISANQSNLFHQTPNTSAASPVDHEAPVTPHNFSTINVGPFPETPEVGTSMDWLS